MLRKLLLVSGLGLAALGMGGISQAEAQASIWNGYQGSSDVSLSFVPSDETGDPDLHYLGVSVSQNTPSNSITFGSGNKWTVDTGSTGVVITADYLLKEYGIQASTLPETDTATITYTSSGLTYSGFHTTLNLGLYNATGAAGGVLAATAQLPVLVATQLTDSNTGKTINFDCTSSADCTPNADSLEQFGVGFGRGTGSGDTNPLLNLTSVSTGNLQTIAPGYVVSSSGIQLGLTSAQLQDTAFASLLPSTNTTSTSLTNAYATAATKTDWQTPATTITIKNAKNAADDGTFYGSLLVDAGIANAELSTGGTYWNPFYNAANPSQSSSVAVYLPGETSAPGQPLSYVLVYQGTCTSTTTGACPKTAPYENPFGLSPVYPVNSSDAPTDGIAFVSPSASTPVFPFLNTGAEFLNYFNVIYDPVSGFFGYQVSPTADQTSNDPALTSSIALQGAVTIPGGTVVSLPTFLFAEFVDGVSGTAGPQTMVQLSSPGQVTLSGVISSDIICGSVSCAATGLEIAGGGFTLTANNTYLGDTLVDPGATLALAGNGSIAASAGVTANGIFDISGTSAGATIAGLGGSGAVRLGGQTLTLNNASGSFAGVLADGGLNGGIGGSLTIAGGSQTLTGANSYTGATTINPGAALLLSGSGSVANSSNLLANGIFDISNTAAGASIVSLSGAGSVNLGGQLLTLTNARGTFAGTIGGTGGLAILGGAEALTGSNSYAGGTVVAGGATLGIASDSALGAATSPLILDNATLTALGNITSQRPVLIGGGGGTLNANGFEFSLNGPISSSGTVTLGNGTTSINGEFAAPALVVSSSGTLHGIGTINAPTEVAGTLSPGNSPGTLTFTEPVTLLPSSTTVIDIDGTGTGTGAGNYSRILVAGAGNSFTAAGKLQPLLRGISGSATNSYTPPLGQSFQIVQAQGGIAGSYSGLTQPASGLAAGTRLDALYGDGAISLIVTPSAYGDLSAAGLAETSDEAAIGTALDAIRPLAGLSMTAAQSALFAPLYQLPPSAITAGLDELSPSIYPDAVITARNAWYLVANTVDSQLASRRGLAPDNAADSAAGPDGSTVWMTALAGYNTTNAGGGAPGFTSGLGGAAAGIDTPVAGTGRIGLAVGSADGQTWAQSGGQATGTTAQLIGYGQWQSGKLFVAAQLGGMYQQENVTQSLPLFDASTRGSTNGTAGGGGIRAGIQERFGSWLLEPSLGFGGFSFHEADLTETGGGLLAQTIGGQSIGSAQTTVGASLQHGMVLSPAVSMVAKATLGWSHEFASDRAESWASFSGLSGSGYQVTSAPIGRDAALIGLLADVKVASWPMSVFAGYGGAINGSSDAQALNVGVHFIW